MQMISAPKRINSELFVSSAIELYNSNSALKQQIQSAPELTVTLLQLSDMQFVQFWIELSFHLNINAAELRKHFKDEMVQRTLLKPESDSISDKSLQIEHFADFIKRNNESVDSIKSNSCLAPPEALQTTQLEQLSEQLGIQATEPQKQNSSTDTEEFQHRFFEALLQTVKQMFKTEAAVETNAQLIKFVQNVQNKTLRSGIWTQMEVCLKKPRKQLENYFAFVSVLQM
ncbi:Hypothetical_protein [Hexamita inflata]|uniref:Hypothetical_protein n=1 Tax=Hexamita inflata TaxID=28002 RepID=A0ABP1I085_9EUKA